MILWYIFCLTADSRKVWQSSSVYLISRCWHLRLDMDISYVMYFFVFELLKKLIIRSYVKKVILLQKDRTIIYIEIRCLKEYWLWLLYWYFFQFCLSSLIYGNYGSRKTWCNEGKLVVNWLEQLKLQKYLTFSRNDCCF